MKRQCNNTLLISKWRQGRDLNPHSQRETTALQAGTLVQFRHRVTGYLEVASIEALYHQYYSMY